MNRVWLFALSGLALLGSGCTAFPDIPTGVCGNSVVDSGEDCDSFSDPATLHSVCRAKGTVGECHLDCSLREGKRPPCPSGWGCDSDAICRRPTNEFLPPQSLEDVGAWSLSSGDFDGDGRDDVMSSEPLDTIGLTRVKFHYFDQQGTLVDTRAFPKQILSPTITTYPGDEPRSDVTFSNGALGLMLGRADRSWVPETFSSYRINDKAVRVAAIGDPRFGAPTAFISLIGPATPSVPSLGSDFYVIDEDTQLLRVQAHVAWNIADLVGEFASGVVLEDKAASPCLDPVFALRQQQHFSILNVCRYDEAVNKITYADPLEQMDIPLDPPAAVDSGPLLADMNGDGHLDVLLDAGGKPYVSYGDGLKLSVATPYRLVGNDATPEHLPLSPDIPMPLAVADVTGDGVPDFVFSDRVLLSFSDPGTEVPIYVGELRNRLGGPVTSAKIADFNRDGYLDIAEASSASLNVAMYMGGPGAFFSPFITSTTAEVQSLAIGDFDRDGVQDLAVLEVPRAGETENSLKIGYGTAFGTLLPLTPAARLDHVEQLAAVDGGGIGALVLASSDLIAGRTSGAVTLLNGTPDRIPFAPFALTDFSATRSVRDSVAFSVSVGRFTDQSRGDLIALAFNQPTQADEVVGMNLWLLANVQSPAAESKRMHAELDARLKPVVLFDQNSDFTVDVASASADFDADGLDEAVFVMPAGEQQAQCGIVVVEASSTGSDAVVARAPVLFDDTCADPVVVPLDADGDKFVDLAILTGRTNDTDRKLYVFWNDGSGSFSTTSVTRISSSEDSPQAFTVLPGSKEQALAFVYVTMTSLRRVIATGSRVFSEPGTLLGQLTRGSGVTAADVNGDRVKDIVLAQSGRLSVLKAQLVGQ